MNRAALRPGQRRTRADQRRIRVRPRRRGWGHRGHRPPGTTAGTKLSESRANSNQLERLKPPQAARSRRGPWISNPPLSACSDGLTPVVSGLCKRPEPLGNQPRTALTSYAPLRDLSGPGLSPLARSVREAVAVRGFWFGDFAEGWPADAHDGWSSQRAEARPDEIRWPLYA